MIGDLLVGSAVGLAAGVAYFGGLRWTLARALRRKGGAGLVAVSYLLRLGAAAALLAWTAYRGGAPALLAALAVMLAVRELLRAGARRGIAPVRPPAEGTARGGG